MSKLLDESYIQITLELAKKGKGKVSPTPLVGTLLVKNDKIIGAAYRSSPDEISTELLAIKNSKENPDGATLYTNLEPCSLSTDKQDCIESIIKSKIKKIVIGTLNPQPEHNGQAVKKFRKAGLEVKTGLLEKECIDINKFYFKYCTKSLPYVTLKMAITIDGKIADSSGNSKWLTSVESRSLVHELRSEYDAVMVGFNSVKIDNPELTVRLVEGRNPKRIILDTNLQLSLNSNLVKKNSDKNFIIITSTKNKNRKRKINTYLKKGIEIIFVPEERNGKIDLLKALSILAERKIISVLVEGGSKVFSSFIKQKLEDEILIFLSPKILGNGLPLCSNLGIKSLSKAINYSIKDVDKIGDDALIKFVRR
ncbi:MAG: bifunctional diaminohydroxyphosphoribosylaminopyrimidine deaminase/5-amino-6-(5-phosphoribosylamino)uracil reductase RibD [Melioribacter sp.]|uniref:bifunctional diaminohydroxyphosphoribosylaminopyrimidine deaminase/5-amino-6-(5-phosphoribosylamino)uracil reductase RibD n=1 Tax=Rosettibacter primus TaxID=3111523 RepID=UPI00247CC151|nr:bifunctional diaminohydroxyphosphoribosylaminopyrimidine deaminase/5-amino-6-(5-phosphoribosylamino)uracil reductase RibD [Melioribacter sp.]